MINNKKALILRAFFIVIFFQNDHSKYPRLIYKE
jgi:hypothetical protein